ncbi:MAG: phage tail protein [Thiohalomonadaceae bacterium]
MSQPLAVLGRFVFGLRTAPFDQLRRSTAQRIASNNRFGLLAAHQHLGPGDDAITITGVLMPEITGGPSTLDDLRAMAERGESYPLLDGEGYYYGYWLIESVEESKSVFMAGGVARKIEFTLNLKRDEEPGV